MYSTCPIVDEIFKAKGIGRKGAPKEMAEKAKVPKGKEKERAKLKARDSTVHMVQRDRQCHR